MVGTGGVIVRVVGEFAQVFLRGLLNVRKVPCLVGVPPSLTFRKFLEKN